MKIKVDLVLKPSLMFIIHYLHTNRAHNPRNTTQELLHSCIIAVLQIVRAACASGHVHERERVLTGHQVVDDALNEVLEYIMRDFVAHWYSRISTHPTFLDATCRTLRHAILLVSLRYLTFYAFLTFSFSFLSPFSKFLRTLSQFTPHFSSSSFLFAFSIFVHSSHFINQTFPNALSTAFFSRFRFELCGKLENVYSITFSSL